MFLSGVTGVWFLRQGNRNVSWFLGVFGLTYGILLVAVEWRWKTSGSDTREQATSN
jgi:hypothetical protein